jgi:uncharacterized protein involved in outer membrane biogenesis
VTIVLDPGTLRLDPIRASIGDRGILSGSLSLTSRSQLLSISTGLRIADANASLLLGGEQREDGPRLDCQLQLDGSGASPHELAAGSNGIFYLALSSGKIESSILDSLGDSIFLSILDALNPFRKKETMTDLDCAVIAGTIDDGKVTLDPVGLKTTKVTTVAHGTVDLGTEKLSLDFASKGRRGLGISASTLTNEAIKIGGTLANPSVQLKPISAAAKTGLAVVTAGISLLAEGLWNRISSETDLCTAMNDEIHQMWTARATAERKPPPSP